jgi:predicted ATP-dependent endonuclease of OLD family
MSTSLRLERFPNFKDTELRLGPFTVLIGANTLGKSSLRNAFRKTPRRGSSRTMGRR